MEENKIRAAKVVRTVRRADGVKFLSWRDVVAYFDAEPPRLLEYVGTALERAVSIPGVHVNQLIRKVGIPLTLRGKVVGEVPENALINLGKLDNVGVVVSKGGEMFPDRFS